MQLQVSLPIKILVTAIIMLVFIAVVYLFSIPNPNMILIAGLVLCSALFGYGGGAVAGVIMFFYTLYFFSTGHNFTAFTPENMQKVIVSLIGIAVDMVLVCELKRAEVLAFSKVDELTNELHEENEILKSISQTDALTGIRNRMGLRNDYDSYRGNEVTVMLLDVDRFKSINDFYGHDEGDRVLVETGTLLIEAFGENHCYRYGGDEFLVIDPTSSEEEFNEKLGFVMKNRPLVERGGESSRVGFSAGYVHTVLDDEHDLRDLFAEADQRMYKEKRGKLRSEAIEKSQAKKRNRDEVGDNKAGYTGEQMKALLESMSGMYDLARVVDPIECRILDIGSDGTISRKERCYGIWNSDQKCVNCTSALACQTRSKQKKDESFDDQVYHIQSNPVTLLLPDGGAYDAVVELVSIEKEAQNAQDANDRAAENVNQKGTRYHAQHDSLTKVLNANAFSELSREEIAKHAKSHWTMITTNIMDFRLINTLFGAQKGNEVLVRTGAVLRRIARMSNGLCARLGGDQFAMLIPRSMYREEALADAAQALSDEFSTGQYTFCMHFGVYEVEDAAIPVSVMCDRANTALRTIRKDLREYVAYFDDDMMQESLFAQKVISGFEDAMNEGRLMMFLQPLALKDGSIFGAEALVRWRQPDGAIVMPVDFIETLERAGLIYRLDMFIWECAVKQLASWSGTPKQDLTISVNMSAKDFFFIDVYQVLTDLVSKYNVPSNKLRVEITETALIDDPKFGNEVVSKLQQKGFLVEIDDFGKGHSSLSQLRDINADVLKIDMSLIREIESKPRSRTILESIVNMAISLGMDVIAEGVETSTQLELLAAMGCRHFQGYYFSRPICVDDFEAMVE